MVIFLNRSSSFRSFSIQTNKSFLFIILVVDFDISSCVVFYELKLMNSSVTTRKITRKHQTVFSILIILLTMRCAVVYYIFCWSFLLFKSLPTETSKVARIIGGRDVLAEDEIKYQYVVRLQIQIINSSSSEIIAHIHKCTAAVLSPTWALTAGHCLHSDNLEFVIDPKIMSFRQVVLYGSHNKSSVVIDAIIHPAHKSLLTLNNDIGLMRHNPIILNQYARLSGLDYVSMIGHEVTLTGYGTTIGVAVTINGTLIPIVADTTTVGKPLQLLDALIVQCSIHLLHNPRICLARRCNKLSGICPGDSGGPVLHDSSVVGINSLGSEEMKAFCNLQPFSKFYDPGHITPISPYIDWISSIIRYEEPK